MKINDVVNNLVFGCFNVQHSSQQCRVLCVDFFKLKTIVFALKYGEFNLHL